MCRTDLYQFKGYLLLIELGHGVLCGKAVHGGVTHNVQVLLRQ